ncbi:aromatic amino acid aminotransferase [Longimonas halophila]|uniref:Aminotransferase n=1 Tax=Longimonas halophila TaxID=1469170 RepID=A0A2H3PB62_9BACT|nr:aminotransferase class I/II-fold pyridoxal phosphate-dependent enzyme [Longimonas halophila]PEN09508.1 aromatic amino acid aminotransferase [Longimonas halophila]
MSDAAVTADLETYLSERVRSTPPSGIRRFFEIAATMDDVISLGIGEPDFVTPQPAVQAGIDALNDGQTSYTANAGRADLRTAISEELSSRYGVSYDAEDEILSTVGVSEAMQLTMLSVLDPGDEILIPEPCFVSYAPTARFAEANVVHVPTSVENNFQVTAETLESYITPNTKALFLGYPNNPTGAVLRRDTLEDIAALVQEHDLLVISDEIYDRLVYGEAHERGHVCVPSIDGLRERTILLGGFSKGYAMTGWRIGYACAPAPILRGLYKVHQYMIMSAPTVSQIAAHTAITECQDEVETMRQAYDERRRVLVDGLNEAGLPTFEPEGAFYCFPDIRSTGLTSEEFVQQLLEEEHVACVPGDAFGPSGAGYVRCSYATGLDDVKEAVRRIQRFAAKHQNG